MNSCGKTSFEYTTYSVNELCVTCIVAGFPSAESLEGDKTSNSDELAS